MIGKMYRPMKILNIPGKRGFNILNKYKSRFAGADKFQTDIYLKYNAENNTEEVHLNFKGLDIPVYMEKGHSIDKDTVISSLEERKIESLRKMIRPSKISSKEELELVILIASLKDKTENDLLELTILPIVEKGEECLRLDIKCNTPVVVHSTSSVILKGQE